MLNEVTGLLCSENNYLGLCFHKGMSSLFSYKSADCLVGGEFMSSIGDLFLKINLHLQRFDLIILKTEQISYNKNVKQALRSEYEAENY